MKGHYTKRLIEAVEAAGFEFERRAKNKHLVYKREGSQPITIPSELDNPRLFHRLRKLTEAQPS